MRRSDDRVQVRLNYSPAQLSILARIRSGELTITEPCLVGVPEEPENGLLALPGEIITTRGLSVDARGLWATLVAERLLYPQTATTVDYLCGKLQERRRTILRALRELARCGVDEARRVLEAVR